jgi:hypothetical protein
MDDEYLAFLESEFEPESQFEFDLGMCLGVLLDMMDNPDCWDDVEANFMVSVCEDLIERFTVKYQTWIEEYGKRKTEQ